MKTNIQGQVLEIKLAGELDHHSASEMKDKLDAVYERSGCKHMLFDFSEVSFMDSSGIGMIIGRYKNAEKRGGKVVITHMNQQLKKVFDISGLHKIIQPYATASEAGQALEEI